MRMVRRSVRVDMRVGEAAVLVLVDVEVAATPAQEEPGSEVDDHGGDRRLRALLDALGEVLVEQEDRKPEGEHGDGVAEAPGKPSRAGRARGSLATPRDECRDRKSTRL